MGLLHSLKGEAAQSALWELGQLAEEVGVPLPPPLAKLDLPAVLGAVGSGDPQALLSTLGPVAAEALGVQLKDPALQALIRGDLEGAQEGLTGYLTQLAGQKTDLLARLADLTGTQGALGEAQGLLDGVRGAVAAAQTEVGELVNGPLTGAVLSLVAQASPEVATLLGYAQSALDTVDGRLSGAEGLRESLTGQLADLRRLEATAQSAAAELDDRLSGLDALFASLEELLP